MRRLADPKTAVRKSALQAFMGLLKHGVIPMTTENLLVLSERCRDPALSVRKKALQCLGELLTARPESGLVQQAWLQGVVPALVDTESSVQEKALEALEETLLRQVKGYSPQRHLDAPQRLAWDLLGLLCYECHNLSRYFSRAFSVWSPQNKFSSSFCAGLLSHTSSEHGPGAWLLLSHVARCTPNLPLTPVLDAWDTMQINQETRSRIVEELMSWVKSMELSLEAFMELHCGPLVSLCESHLASILLSHTRGQHLDQDLMDRLHQQDGPLPHVGGAMQCGHAQQVQVLAPGVAQQDAGQVALTQRHQRSTVQLHERLESPGPHEEQHSHT
ncbi:hypothetical protein CRUP_007976 [Coryphaenoides rupestris]|nr:hypothetical protein CRUP_007976 [Coryphaenoides rupestris]